MVKPWVDSLPYTLKVTLIIKISPKNNIINVAAPDFICTSYIGRIIMFMSSYAYTDYISIIRFVTTLISQLVMLISTQLLYN